MPLSEGAIRRALAVVRDAPAADRFIEFPRTLPITSSCWNHYSRGLSHEISLLSEKFLTPLGDSFDEIRNAAQEFVASCVKVSNTVGSLEPFANFDSRSASRILALLDDLRESFIDRPADERRSQELLDQLKNEASSWQVAGDSVVASSLGFLTFGVERALVDEYGHFRADRVFEEYAYESMKLYRRLLPHLRSLDVFLTDPLASIAIVGSIVMSPDPVVAAAGFRTFVSRFNSADLSCRDGVKERLRSNEPARRRSRNAIGRLRGQFDPTGFPEERQFVVADMYRREVEGPFRQFIWASYQLGTSRLKDVPTLGPLKQEIVANDALLAAVLSCSLLPDVRNGEVHETLEWDGFVEEFVAETGVRIKLEKVEQGFEFAHSYARGCEAALAAVTAWALDEDSPLLPSPDETNRLANIERARSYFGTNRLRVLDAQLESRVARIALGRLSLPDLNPCFQALILTSRVLPRVESFQVSSVESTLPLVEVSRKSIEATMSVWEFAIAHLDSMPFSTFLPMNFEARRVVESRNIALKAVAWIAVDDVLDAIVGTPLEERGRACNLLAVRFELVGRALAALTDYGAAHKDARVRDLRSSVAALRAWVSRESEMWLKDRSAATIIERLRRQHEDWGPAPRHPLVLDDAPERNVDLRPALRRMPESPRFITL